MIVWGSGPRDQQAWTLLGASLVTAWAVTLTVVVPVPIDFCHSETRYLTPHRTTESRTPSRDTVSLRPRRSTRSCC